MKVLFPPEIIENTVQAHFVERSSRSKVIYLAVICAIVLALGLTPFIYIDISAQSKGLVRSVHDNNKLMAMVAGEVEQVNLYENKPVHKGDTLLVINADKLKEQMSSYQRKIAENGEFLKDLNCLLYDTGTIHSLKYLGESRAYKTKKIEILTEIAHLKREYTLSETLYKKNIVPEYEFLKQKNLYDLSVGKQKHTEEQYKNTWKTEFTRLELESKEHGSILLQLQKELQHYTILAPVPGEIIQFVGLHKGNYISPSQIIALISQEDSLIAENYVSSSDIGFIRKGQKISYQIDAFNYNQWGFATGEVTQISSDIMEVDGSYVYKVRSRIDSKPLRLKNGIQASVRKGMTFTSRFHLTRRSLWQLLFDKVDDWINPKLL